jgi:hypothetical protein
MKEDNVSVDKYVATRDTLFDTLFLPDNLGSQSNIHAFTIPLGQYAGRRVKDVSDTNMLMAGMLPPPETFDVQELSVVIADGKGSMQAWESEWWREGILSFRVNTLVVVSGPLSQFANERLFETIRKQNVLLRRLENGKTLYNRPLIRIDAARAEPRIVEIHAQENFGCRVIFASPMLHTLMPVQMVIGISGIHYFPEL